MGAEAMVAMKVSACCVKHRLVIVLAFAGIASGLHEKDESYLGHLSHYVSSSDVGDSHLRGADGFSFAALAGEDCENDEKWHMDIEIGVFGELKDYEAKKQAAGQWLLIMLIDSMTSSGAPESGGRRLLQSFGHVPGDGEPAWLADDGPGGIPGGDIPEEDPGQGGFVPPEDEDTSLPIEPIMETEPQLTNRVLDAWTADVDGHISPARRTFFRTRFEVPACLAPKYIQHVCADYASEDQVLLTAILRSLDNADLYPHNGLDIASQYGGLKSALTLRVDLRDVQENIVPNVGCGQNVVEGSVQAELLLPSCPDHSVKCSDNPALCTKEEVELAPWMCKCDMAYEGNLSLPSFTLQDGQLTYDFDAMHKIRYTGMCTPREQYCNTADPFPDEATSVGFNMLLPGVEHRPATGVLGEEAQPTCPPGTKHTGTSQCVADTLESGKWEPYRKCAFVAPMPPPPPEACPALDATSLVLSDACSKCRPKDPDNPKEFVPCECKPQCKDGYKHTAGPAEGDALECDLQQYKCPPIEELNWDADCMKKSDGSLVNKFCCEEAWGGLKPEPLKKKTCSDIVTEADCLTARDSSTGMPCCFRDDGFQDKKHCAAKGSAVISAATPSRACAVGPELFYGTWKSIPTCTLTCDNTFAGEHSIVEVSTCEDRAPGEKCEIKCADAYENYGPPELVGDRVCEAESHSFGELPICLRVPAVPTCMESALEAPTLEAHGNCRNCRAGTDDCAKCEVMCISGSKMVAGSQGVKQCLLVDNPETKEVAACSAEQGRDSCLLGFQAGEGGKLPCCWSQDEGDAGKCMAKNSADITPDVVCTEMTAAEFEPFPTCEVQCPNIFLAMEGINNTKVRTDCGSCVPSEGEACPCEVECAAGLERFGGGAEGKKACLAGDPTPAFVPGPICDLPEKVPYCVAPEAPTAELSDACTGCQAGEDCGCKVTCPAGSKKVGGGKEGPKACLIQNTPLGSDALCSEKTTFVDCIHSKDSSSGQPCCFNEDGLAEGGGKCIDKMSVNMIAKPERKRIGSHSPACAPLMKGEWDEEMPVCEAIVTHAWETVPNVVFDEEKCGACVLSEPCECEVKCAPGFERYGGGPEGLRQPVAAGDGKSAPTFGPAPLCLEPEPAPRCVAPVVDSNSLMGSGCTACTAGAADCDCTVECHPGYAPLGEVDAYVPKKTCTEVPAAVTSQSCRGLDAQTCLKSAQDGQPCGLTQDGVCLQKGSPDFKSTDTKAKFTKLRSFQWDKMPVCHLLCVNTFTSPLLEVVGNCDTCFAGPENKEPCEKQCSVECAPGTKFVQGYGAIGPKSCDEAGSFGEAPNCIPVSPTVENPKCLAPPNSKKRLELTAGCSKCTAGDSSCDCNVQCATGMLAVTPDMEGAKECELVYFKCPKLTTFDKEKAICKDGKTQEETDYLCCTEAWMDKPPHMASHDCTGLTAQEECLGSKDATSDKPCCWFGDGESSAGADPKVCVPKESNLIDDDHLPQECADRRAVKKYKWQEMPDCAPICKQDFTSLTSSVVATDCDKCHGHDKNDCDCKVECQEGFEYYGRGALGSRKCDSATAAFGPPPLCLPKKDPPACDLMFVEPEVYSLTDCRDCTAGDDCACQVHCNAGFTHVEGSPAEGHVGCHLATKKLIGGKCEGSTYSTCMDTEEDGAPCCWVSGECLAKGSKDILQAPDECADDPTGEWDAIPECSKACNPSSISILADVYNFDYENCHGCVAGDKNCQCTLTCRPGYKRVGGGEEGGRTCSVDDVSYSHPPICIKEGLFDPEPSCGEYPQYENVKTMYCANCVVGDADCWCKATCYRGSTALPGTSEGAKTCVEAPNPLADVSDAGCSSLKDRTSCLTSAEQSQEATCCWNSLEGWCAPQNDRDMPGRPDVCAPTLLGQWKDHDNPLRCGVVCTHDFPAPPAYSYDEEACSKCVAGGECDCEIKCSDGYERVGGGSEGARSCTLENTAFEVAPVCMKKPESPICPDVQDPSFTVTGCSGCRVGEEGCKCSVGCAPGYTETVPVPADGPKCTSFPADDYSDGQPCSALFAEDCVRSQQEGKPCCYRRWLLSLTLRCLPKGDPQIDYEPDECAPMEVGQWDGLPECSPQCPNIFKNVKNLDYEDCDGCVPGEECKCKVKCKDGTSPVGGTEGLKTCALNPETRRAEFESAPMCMQQCPAPDDALGTLDISRCQKPCFPGQPCDCEVSCRLPNNFYVGGGSENVTLRCQEENGVATFKGLPECLPKCTKPDDQLRTLDNRGCRTSCDAGWECGKGCNLKCYGEYKGGGPEGKRQCMFFPGVAPDERGKGGRGAVGRWVNVDHPDCQGKSAEDLPDFCQELPMCMSTFNVTVVSARTKEPLDGASVMLSDPEGVLVPLYETTDKRPIMGLAKFQTSMTNLKITVWKEGYNSQKRLINRLEMCAKATDCGVVIPIAPELESGDFHPEECSVVVDEFGPSYNQQEWTMQATLTWAETPKDLDIWVRNYDCADQINRRYMCTEKTGANHLRYQCARNRERMINDREISKAERLVCGKYYVDRKAGSTASQPEFDKKTGVLKRRKSLHNQFQKWVMHDSRMLHSMQWKITGELVKQARSPNDPCYRAGKCPDYSYGINGGLCDSCARGWNPDNWLLLDTDERSGWGPETVTFHNAPPGKYQIYVDIFKVELDEVGDIRKAKPRVDLSMGKLGVKVICEPSPWCKRTANSWQVADISVRDAGPAASGKRKYKIEIEDRYDTGKMQDIYRFEQPSRQNDRLYVSRSRRDLLTTEYGYRWFRYWQNEGNGYSDMALRKVCRGRCFMDEDFDEYDECLVKYHDGTPV